jgi:hypothetical protein
MRDARRLVGCHDAIDDCGAVGLKRFVDLGERFTGFGGAESMPAASPRERKVDRIGNSIPSRYAGSPTPSASNVMSPNDELL